MARASEDGVAPSGPKRDLACAIPMARLVPETRGKGQSERSFDG
ncbi:hypothetical protein CSE45_2283 [Citreicella sp. SE45]|nr:hypothetical protein CSE45_2283 [Citreicella sp. SE45]